MSVNNNLKNGSLQEDHNFVPKAPSLEDAIEQVPSFFVPLDEFTRATGIHTKPHTGVGLRRNKRITPGVWYVQLGNGRGCQVLWNLPLLYAWYMVGEGEELRQLEQQIIAGLDARMKAIKNKVKKFAETASEIGG